MRISLNIFFTGEKYGDCPTSFPFYLMHRYFFHVCFFFLYVEPSVGALFSFATTWRDEKLCLPPFRGVT